MGNCLSGPWTMTRGAVPGVGGFISPAENSANRCLQRSDSGNGVTIQFVRLHERPSEVDALRLRSNLCAGEHQLSLGARWKAGDRGLRLRLRRGRGARNIIPDVSRWAFQNWYEVTDNNTQLPIVGDFDK